MWLKSLSLAFAMYLGQKASSPYLSLSVCCVSQITAPFCSFCNFCLLFHPLLLMLCCANPARGTWMWTKASLHRTGTDEETIHMTSEVAITGHLQRSEMSIHTWPNFSGRNLLPCCYCQLTCPLQAWKHWWKRKRNITFQSSLPPFLSLTSGGVYWFHRKKSSTWAAVRTLRK